MNIVYLGTPDFAVLPLINLIENTNFNIVSVVTNKYKPVGRKNIITPPPVKVVANKYGIPVYQYDKIRLEGVDDIKKLNPDLMITCAFGQILSKEILDIPKFGVINIHDSLLPKYRGASPIHHAILNGEKETGITIMKTDLGVDTGDIIAKESVSIGEDETCGELFDKLSKLGAELIVRVLPQIFNGDVKYEKQDDSKATHTKIFDKKDALIDWNDKAENVYNKIRAFNPSPIAYCTLNGQPFKVYKAEIVDGTDDPGKIIEAEKRLVIACKEKALSLITVQKAGGKAMNIKDFLRGNKFTQGEYFN
ncbi:MAG: methionyl-tRNA formyltransferase [Clostridia bacterium]|nr:methionyl-tRNA formyltransferase [Clostridia bacterium]